MKYEKKPFSCEEHVEILKDRGLKIPNEERAIKYLNTVGYFRLTGYMYHLQENDGTHKFKGEVSFDDIINLYQFDKKLRGIINEYLERVEVALRAKLTNYFSVNHGFFWLANKDLFADLVLYGGIIDEITEDFVDPQESFLKSFKLKYTSESFPPSNMALETLTMGKLTRLYKALKNDTEKMQIASDFNVPSSILTSWIIYLTNVRNICAHHARLWNKRVTADQPLIPSREKYKFKGEITSNFHIAIYGIISLINRLLSSFNPENSFIKRIEQIIEEHNIDTSLMGFPENWKKVATWHNE
ncbi:Abi family protein [Flavobacterium sp.]|jgi:abortive infection bacteriophage resistance protein|uniref:Abi family protein n=1 Tax=Flavobacterium sp. TaxID=239 RepID=UPI0037C10D45